jgi:hypothetical protein
MKKIFLSMITVVMMMAVHVYAQTVSVTASHLTNSSGQPLSGYVYFQPTLTNGQPTWYRMPSGGTVSSNPVPVIATNGAISVTLPDTTQTYPANICFTMSYPGGTLAIGYACLQPHTTAYNASDWCQAGACDLDNFLPGNQPLPSTNAVQAINYTAGQLNFTGPGVTQSGNTFTFNGGSSLSFYVNQTCVTPGVSMNGDCISGSGTIYVNGSPTI